MNTATQTVELKKGDAIFFNPATFHAAGTNTSKDIVRFANLMQIGSGYGRSIEVVDRIRMSKLLFPKLKAMIAASAFSERDVEHIIAACAEGYSFPVNLDIDSPLSVELYRVKMLAPRKSSGIQLAGILGEKQDEILDLMVRQRLPVLIDPIDPELLGADSRSRELEPCKALR